MFLAKVLRGWLAFSKKREQAMTAQRFLILSEVDEGCAPYFNEDEKPREGEKAKGQERFQSA